MTYLSERMQAVADMVKPGNVVADIGCDHGFLPIYLIESKKNPSAIAMDLREGPLLRAKEHIEKAGLQDKICLRLSDGLAMLKPDEAKTIVIAGMGGPLMMQILNAQKETAKAAEEIILQPQSEIAEFRKNLKASGYHLLKEAMVYEEGKYYPMMRVSAKENAGTDWKDEKDFLFGRLLILEKNPVLKKYLLKEKKLQNKIKIELNKAEKNEPRIKKRLDFVEWYLKEIEQTQELMR